MLHLYCYDLAIVHFDHSQIGSLACSNEVQPEVACADWPWRLQVCDFNLSRVMEESAILSSMAASNPRWLAPEILSGRGYTFSSDVYSFGVIMWEFLTWQIPWHECGPWQVLHYSELL